MRNKKKKIAGIGLKGLPAFGGAAIVGGNIIKKLKDKYDFTVYAISSHTDKRRFYNGFKQVVFKAFPLKKLNILYYYIASSIHVLLKGNYDLIHLHHRDATFILIILKLKNKVILTTHGMAVTEKWKKYNFLFRLQDKIFIRFSDNITCVSLKDRIILKKITKKNILQIPNGVRPNNLISNNIFINENKKYIMFGAGRILPSKGCHIFLEAMQKLNYKDEILIAGDLNQISKYKAKIIHLAKSLNVRFTGLIKEKNQLTTYIRQSKIFIFPSSIESMSIMLLEVASTKTPLICSDISENKVIFNEDEVLFFKTGDVDDLATKIEWALSNEEVIKVKAEKAYKKVIKKYSWEKIAKQYDKVYLQII